MSALDPGYVEPLSPEVFERARTLIRDRAGLAFDSGARALFERRLSERVVMRNCASFAEYLSVFEQDTQEQDAVYTLLTTKETYFFRQEYQLRAFVDEVLPRVIEGARAHRRLTIWSAGCSTGEEAYTIAMLLMQVPELARWHLRVLGTDLCQQNIDAAIRGVYRPSSFRTTEKEWLDSYFEPEGGGSYRIKESVRSMCHFSRVNLMSPLALRAVGRIDVAFCRNVLIYFDDLARRKVTDGIYQRLLPGGYLLLGHSESLLNTDTKFLPVHLEGDLVYRRPPMTTFSGRPM